MYVDRHNEKTQSLRECFLKNRSKLQMTIMVAEAGFEPAASRLSSPRELPLLYSAVSPPRCCRTGRHGGKHGFQAFEFQPFVALLNYNYSLCSSGFQGKLMQKFIVFFSLCAPIPFLAHVGCDLLPRQPIHIPQR